MNIFEFDDQDYDYSASTRHTLQRKNGRIVDYTWWYAIHSQALIEHGPRGVDAIIGRILPILKSEPSGGQKTIDPTAQSIDPIASIS